MSDAMIGILLFALCIPIPFIMAAFLTNETKPKKNIILGVTLPFFARDDVQVLQIGTDFRRKVWFWTILLVILGVPPCFLPWFSVQMTIYFLWLIAVIMVPSFLYARANLRLKALKKEKSWFFQPYAGQTVVDLSTVGIHSKPLSGWWFVPPLVISLVPIVLAWRQGTGDELTGWIISCGSIAAMVLLSWVCYPLIFRQKADVVDEDSHVNEALTNVRRVNWGRAWIAIAWTTSLLGAGIWFLRDNAAGILALTMVYTLILLGLCGFTEFSVRRAQERLSEHSGKIRYVDEDAYWIWGMFYCNPNDRHLAVNDRVGMNMSFNLARPAGKIIMGLSALLIAAMPFFGVWMMAVEFSPRTATLNGQTLSVVHVTEQFSVPLEEVRSAELLAALPKYSRTVGTGMSSLCEGSFQVKGYGGCRVTFDPRQASFIILKTEDATYIFNLESPQETKACYDRIQEGNDGNE